MNKIKLSDYQAPDFAIDQLELAFDLDFDRTKVKSKLWLRRLNPKAESLWLDGEELELHEVRLDGRKLGVEDYQLREGGLELLELPEACVLEIENSIMPRANTALEGLYASSQTLCTQCEPHGFRRITYFIDRPDVMCKYRVRLEGSKADFPVMLGGGNRVDGGESGSGRHWVVWEDPFPKPSYLFAVVAGDLAVIRDSFETCSGRSVKLEIYSEKESIDDCHYAMESLVRAMAWDEKRFGLEYDLDEYKIVAIGDFNMGAMENKGLNIFNTAYVLANPETTKDNEFVGVESVIGHEYFHNWSGNRVTCRDWFQLCLKEGLTVFRDQEFSYDMGGAEVSRIGDIERLLLRQFPEDQGPMAHPPRPSEYQEINNFYTATVYEKGGEIVRMLQTLLGLDGFRKGLDLYFERHDGQAVTQEDFIRCMEEASTRDLSQFMLWYTEPGTPVLKIVEEHDASKAQRIVSLTQSVEALGAPQSHRHIPIKLALFDANGSSRPVTLAGESNQGPTERLLEMTAMQETFVFEGVSQETKISWLRGFSAPVKLLRDTSSDELMFWCRHETDPVNLWFAVQKLYTRQIFDLVDQQSQKETPELNPGLVSAVSSLVLNSKVEPGIRSLAVKLPALSKLALERNPIPLEELHQARSFLARQLGESLAAQWQEIYHETQKASGHDLSPLAMGQRSLKNLALDFLASTRASSVAKLLLQQFESAENMTDHFAALQLMSHWDHPYRESMLDQFYTKWQSKPLVIDSWFRVQAQSELMTDVGQVQALIEHKDYDARNPNRFRSLVLAYCSGNLLSFHNPSSGGYEFCRDYVQTMDSINPQMASHLARSFERWRQFDPKRQERQKQALGQIVETQNLSADVSEVVEKMLAHS